MTDVTQERDQAGAELSAADEQVLRELTERARTGGLKLAGEGGLLGRLTKMVIEGALEGELDDHLGYAKHDPEGRDSGNSRNGHRAKTVITDTGPVEISVPRDRDSSFEPKMVANVRNSRRAAARWHVAVSAAVWPDCRVAISWGVEPVTRPVERPRGLAHASASFVGRSAAVGKVADLLDTYRLVTITGPGGVGQDTAC